MDQIDKEVYNVLYVDDEQSSLNAFKNLFRRKFNIVTASSGQQALEILKARPVKVIISDQRMPKMTGVEFLKKVKNKWPETKCVLFTGYEDSEVVKAAINEVRIFWYMNKPFNPDQMEQIIKNALNTYQAESTINETKKRLIEVFNSIPDVITRSDMNGKCVMVTPSIYQMLGYKPEELLNRNLADFYADPTQREEIVSRLHESRTVENFEIDVVKKDGSTITVSTNAKIYTNDKGEPMGTEGIFRDITNDKMAEKKILEYQNHLKGLANELTLTEEKVRKQIAADLHDNVGQMLASIRMQLSRIIDMEENPELIIRMKSISNGLLKSVQATRAAIYNLSPPHLNEIGLVAATHDWMKEQIEQKHHIKTVISSKNEKFKLDENTLVLLFRSIKELMMNTVKHAKASQLTTTFKRKDNLLEIAVEDDGVGFNYGVDLLRLKKDSYGLFSIQERISDLGGVVEVDSTIDKGTKIKLTVPLSDKRA